MYEELPEGWGLVSKISPINGVPYLLMKKKGSMFAPDYGIGYISVENAYKSGLISRHEYEASQEHINTNLKLVKRYKEKSKT